MNPKPIARDKLPVYFGGESMPALRRIARYGTGWLASNLSPAQMRERLAKLHEMLRANGRSPGEVRIMMMPGPAHFNPEHLAGYRDVGVEEVVVLVNLTAKQQDNIGKLEHLATRWVEPAAKLG